MELGRAASKERRSPIRSSAKALTLETRPGLRMTPGQSVACDVDAAAGSRLDFAFGLTDAAPAVGSVRVRVEADGAVVYEDHLVAEQKDRWQPASVVLPKAGRVKLAFRADHVDGSGHVVVVADPPQEPWIVLGSARVAPPATPGARRVLVWISQDTVRADHVGAYGYARPTTPRFDRLSRDFVVFDDGVAAASWTLPSLASQFTSRYPSFHGAVT